MLTKIAALVLLAALISGLLSLATYSNRANMPATTQSTKPQEPTDSLYYTKRDLKAQEDMATFAKWSIWINLFIGGATAFIAWMVYQSNKRQWDEARAQSQTELRAYVGIKDITFHNEHPSGPYFKAQLINEGQTPAYKITLETSVLFLECTTAKEHYEETFKEPDSTAFTLNPNAERSSFNHYGVLEEKEWAKIRDGSHGFYFIIRIFYRDAFGKTWGYEMSGKHGPETGGVGKNTIVLNWMPERHFMG